MRADARRVTAGRGVGCGRIVVESTSDTALAATLVPTDGIRAVPVTIRANPAGARGSASRVTRPDWPVPCHPRTISSRPRASPRLGPEPAVRYGWLCDSFVGGGISVPQDSCPACAKPLSVEARMHPSTACPSCGASLGVVSGQDVMVVTRSEGGGTGPRFKLSLTPEFKAQYELGRLVGSGSMGAVFAATKRSTARSVAVKFLTVIANERLSARFLQEARLLAQIQHPNVVRVIDVGSLGAHLYLVTDLLEGGALDSRLARQGRMPMRDALAIAIDCLEGLGELHSKGIVHRDLKPANVLFDAQGSALIGDLGIAKEIAGTERFTCTGEFVGTPRYASPEQFLRGATFPASDLYSMGLILYEMLAGQHPFQAQTLPALVEQQLDVVPPLLTTVIPGVPARLSALVARALDKSPDNRPASAAAFAQELRAVLREHPSSRRTEKVRPRPTGKVSPLVPGARRLTMPVLLAAVLALGIVIGQLTRPQAREPAAPPSPTASPAARGQGMRLDEPREVASVEDEVAEVRRLRDEVENGTQPLAVWNGNFLKRTTSPCPLVVHCIDHLRQVVIHARPGCVVKAVNDQPVAPQQTLAIKASSPLLREGINLVQIEGPGMQSQAGTARFERGACAFPIRALDRAPDEFVVFHRVSSVLESNVLATETWAKSRSLAASLVPAKTSPLRMLLDARIDYVGSVVTDDWREINECVARTQSALATSPSLWASWHVAGILCLHSGSPRSCRCAFLKALMIWPESPWTWVELAAHEAGVWASQRKPRQGGAIEADAARRKAERYLALARRGLRSLRTVSGGDATQLERFIASIGERLVTSKPADRSAGIREGRSAGSVAAPPCTGGSPP